MSSFTVVSTMKNEAPFILDWLAHYKFLGFDKFVICTNDCSDGTVRMLRRLQNTGHITHHQTKIRAGGIHRSALRQAARYPEVVEADWVFVCDVDEYLNIHVGDGSVRGLVDAVGPEPEVISLPWRIFGANGIKEIEDAPVTEQFFMGELPYDPALRPDTGKFVKSLYRPSEKLSRVGLHFPIFKEECQDDVNWVDGAGQPYVVNGQRTAHVPDFMSAQINHYAVRSANSYLVKRDRGRANHSSHILGMEYWEKFNLNHEEDRSIRRYAEGVARIKSELLEDFRLRKIHRNAMAWHRNKAAEMRENPELGDLVSALDAAL